MAAAGSTVVETLQTVLEVIGLAKYLGAFQAATEAVHQFRLESDKLFEAQTVFRNLGLDIGLGQYRAFATDLARQTGIARTELEGIGERLAEVGVRANQIEPVMRQIADVARSHGAAIEEVTAAVERGVEGEGRGLKRFGITLQETGSRAANLFQILQQLSLRFQGGAADYGTTIGGALDRLSESIREFQSAFAERFAPMLIALFNKLADFINWLTDRMDTLISLLALIPGIGGLIAGARGAGGLHPMAEFSRSQQPATEATALRIADNTAKTLDAIEQFVLGGPGTRAKEAFTYRDHHLSLSYGRPNFARR
jgi:uncharacterized protein YqgV (UPF0045/DUF77 family)